MTAPSSRDRSPLKVFEEGPRQAEVGLVLDRLFPTRLVERVLLVHPPDTAASLFDYATCRRRCYPHYPPYGLMSIASHLRAAGVEVEIADINASVFDACLGSARTEDFDYERVCRETIEAALRSFRPDMVGVGCMFSYSHQSFVAICREVRRQAAKVPIIIGGVHVTNSMTSRATSEAFFEGLECVSLVSLYEGDTSLTDLVRVINRQAPPGTLAQLILRTDHVDISLERRRAPVAAEINVLPAFDLVTLGEYSHRGSIGNFYYLKEGHQRSATLLSNRGCRAQCTFCSVRSFNGLGVRRRSPESVVDELLCLQEKHGIDHVMWLDDDFFYDQKASIALFEQMIRRDVRMTWDCSNGVLAASCKDELLAAAAASGCIGLHIGVESGNDDILRQVRKPATVEVYLKAAETLHKHPQIYVRVFLMIGFPGETFVQVWDTVTLARQMALDWHSINVVEPLPNTPMWNDAVADGSGQKVDFENIQYITNPVKFESSGGASRTGSHMSLSFADVFENRSPGAIPSREELINLRAFMDFQLNFVPILSEENKVKIALKRRHLHHILSVVAPGNAVAMYFLGQLQMRVDGQASPELVGRLETTLQDHPVWRERFDTLSLSLTHLRNYSP